MKFSLGRSRSPVHIRPAFRGVLPGELIEALRSPPHPLIKPRSRRSPERLMSPALLLIAAIGAAPASELLDFSATWCGPCQQAKPFIQQLRREGLPVREVDVDRQRDVAQRFNITAMPTFVLVIEGREVDRVVGYRPGETESDIRRLVAKIPPAKTEPTSKTVEAEPEKKPWFTPPWNRKSNPPPTEPPQFEEPAVVRGQPIDVAAPVESSRPVGSTGSVANRCPDSRER